MGVGEGEGEGAGSCDSTRMASRERGIGAAFGMWWEAKMRKGRRNMGMAVMRIVKGWLCGKSVLAGGREL